MKVHNHNEVAELFFECLKYKNFYKELSDYQKEKVLEFALDYEFEISKPRRELFKKQLNEGKKGGFEDIEPDVYEIKTNRLIKILQPIVMEQQKAIDSQHELPGNIGLSTKELEGCIDLIGYWLNEDETVIKVLLNSEYDVVKNHVKPFSKELNKNLLTKETFEGKEGLIKYYVFEFLELQGFFKEYNEIIFNGSTSNYTPKKFEHTDKDGKVRKLNEFENYVVNSWELFSMLFDEIQLCCIKYKIDFYKVCHELNFSIEYVDSGITFAFEASKEGDFLLQSNEAVKDAVSFENNFSNAKLSNRQNALIMIYEGKSITHKDKGVYKYRMFNSPNDRLAEPQNKKAYKDFVNDLNKAIENLQGNSKQKAIDDLNTYESKYKNEYT